MTKYNDMHAKTQKLVTLSFLAALIIVLQFTSSFLVKLGFFSISLVLIPITLGGIIYGVGAGAVLGAVFGIVCLIAGATGLDGGTLTMIQFNFWATALIAIGKGALAGTVSALVYKLFIFICKNKQLPAVLMASVLTPAVNTGVFFLGMLIFFMDLLSQWTGSNTVFGMLTALVGINFILELVLNVIICPVITASLTKNGRIKRIK